MFEKYGKALAAVLFAALTAAQVRFGGDSQLDAGEWVQIGIAAVTAIGVYVVPLAPQYTWTKTVVAVLLSVLQALATVALGGLDPNDYMTLALAALTAVGVGMAPAVSGNAARSRPA